MEITERQAEILNRIVKEYIRLAQPISSQLIERKSEFGVCPATIRREMQRLTEKGFLYQPHPSAGRIPTDKGYRFFVDELMEKRLEDFEFGDWFKEEEIVETIKFIQLLTRNLALVSHSLVLSYLEKEKIFWKEGWEAVLKEPEFREEEYLLNFIQFLKSFQENIGELKINSEIKVYIGKENPFKRAKDFSIISTRCCLPEDGEAIFSLLGPKRMAYERNISLINSLRKLLEEF